MLRDPGFLAGDTTTAYLDDRYPTDDDRRFPPSADAVELALVAVTVASIDSGEVAADRGLPVLAPGFTNAGAFDPHVRLTADATTWRVTYRARRDGTLVVSTEVDAEGDTSSVPATTGERTVTVHRHVGDRLDLEVDGRRHAVVVVRRDDAVAVHSVLGHVRLTVEPRFPTAAAERVEGATLAPMPGAIVSILVAEGDTVAEGALLCTLEAMKMEHRVTAPVAGTVSEVRITVGQQVDADDVLVVVVPSDGDAAAPGADEHAVAD